jgi:aerobic-type carbon monoxide dehydrogenase small subunit (CoxS/CutS family)
MKIEFKLNGRKVSLEVPAKKRLLDILREDFGLIGTKEGCGKGECGSCTVLFDGKRVNSCLIPALQLNGATIITIEGLQNWPVFKDIEQAYLEHGAVQCGLCIPGFVMSTVAFLQDSPPMLSSEEIKNSFSGNICRCTGYDKILNAIHDLSHKPEISQQIQEALSNEQ